MYQTEKSRKSEFIRNTVTSILAGLGSQDVLTMELETKVRVQKAVKIAEMAWDALPSEAKKQ